ncbi:MAG: hypothetical protein K2Q06_10425 [Parvularculaceae bacterium]|nr:hypothetical protein [Parvularculaceae bacterium]
MFRFGRAAAAALIWIVAGCTGGRVVDVEVETRTDATGAGAVVVAYGGLYGLDALDLGPADASPWTVATTGVAVRTVNGKRRLEPLAKGGALPAVVVVSIAPAPLGVQSAANTLGGSGFVVSTAALRPTAERVTSRLSFSAPPRGVAAAQGQAKARLADWSPADGAADRVFIGPADLRATKSAAFVFDSSTPGWIRSEAARLAERLAPAFEKATGRPASRPDVFVGLRSEGDALAWRADARDGQIVLEFLGPYWRDSGPDSGERLQRAVASELAAVELADLAAKKPPTWISDGIADALADEAMTTAGLWTRDDALRSAADVSRRCAESLASATLVALATQGEAARACGHAFARAGAGTKGVAAFARDLGKRLDSDRKAQSGAGKDADAFLRVAAAHAGAHNAALMRTLMSATGTEAAAALSALSVNERGEPAHVRR